MIAKALVYTGLMVVGLVVVVATAIYTLLIGPVRVHDAIIKGPFKEHFQ
jgi:hypothetical protein